MAHKWFNAVNGEVFICGKDHFSQNDNKNKNPCADEEWMQSDVWRSSLLCDIYADLLKMSMKR